MSVEVSEVFLVVVKSIEAWGWSGSVTGVVLEEVCEVSEVLVMLAKENFPGSDKRARRDDLGRAEFMSVGWFGAVKWAFWQKMLRTQNTDVLLMKFSRTQSLQRSCCSWNDVKTLVLELVLDIHHILPLSMMMSRQEVTYFHGTFHKPLFRAQYIFAFSIIELIEQLANFAIFFFLLLTYLYQKRK